MADKFKNKYRISSTRLKSWDYASKAAYFITICTQNREHFFGEIRNGEMILSEIGEIAINEWLKTIELREDMNIEIGEFVVMPNHFHAIIIIGDNNYNNNISNINNRLPKNQFGPQSKNLASIIRGFKSSITTHARKMGNTKFLWQPLYHDHIIRDSQSFDRIQKYIENNPKNWKEDKFHLRSISTDAKHGVSTGK